ncbi:MAG: glyceraldehyde-3-phosphate dehydrogenase [Edaphobacter sp.]|nr:glyceraldehyde-3-phosphate dehydrogenase [Edaphobacter sp.]
MRGVEDDLVVGVAVNGGHDAGGDAEGVVENLDNGSEAVGGAARVGDDVVLGRVVLIFVDAEDDGDVLVARGGGDDDLLDARAEVGFCLLRVGEEAGGFDDDLRAHRGPVEFGRIALSKNLDLLAVNGDEVGSMSDRVRKIAQDGVVLKKVGQGGGGREVVYGYEFDVWVAESAAEYVASNAAEAVDAYLYCCHDFGCSCRLLRGFLRVSTLESAAKSLAHTISDAITGGRAAQMME